MSVHPPYTRVKKERSDCRGAECCRLVNYNLLLQINSSLAALHVPAVHRWSENKIAQNVLLTAEICNEKNKSASNVLAATSVLLGTHVVCRMLTAFGIVGSLLYQVADLRIYSERASINGFKSKYISRVSSSLSLSVKKERSHTHNCMIFATTHMNPQQELSNSKATRQTN